MSFVCIFRVVFASTAYMLHMKCNLTQNLKSIDVEKASNILIHTFYEIHLL